MIPQLLTLESDFGVRIWFKTDDHLIQEPAPEAVAADVVPAQETNQVRKTVMGFKLLEMTSFIFEEYSSSSIFSASKDTTAKGKGSTCPLVTLISRL